MGPHHAAIDLLPALAMTRFAKIRLRITTLCSNMHWGPAWVTRNCSAEGGLSCVPLDWVVTPLCKHRVWRQSSGVIDLTPRVLQPHSTPKTL
eukprot:4632505-Amphidinium_carterae.2